jgi:hypothetical protein
MTVHEHFLAGVCDECPYLDLQATDECLWSNDKIYTRRIEVTCSRIKCCARATRMGMDNMVDIMKGDKT